MFVLSTVLQHNSGIIQFVMKRSFHFVAVTILLTSHYDSKAKKIISVERSGYQISGKISDKSQSPVPYANVALYNVADSSLVDGVISDSTGLFRLIDLSPGIYYLEVNFIGYQTETINGILLTKQIKVRDLGVISLSTSSVQLDEVSIEGERSEVTQEIDRKVISVGADLSVAGGNATNALLKIPSVRQEQNGDISIRGSGSFKVLIDGRPSGLVGNEALKSIPIETIDKIELITNPSAKYSAEGSVGIVNVILKKNKVLGFNATLNAKYSFNGADGGSINANYKSKKVNYYINSNYNFSNQQYVHINRRQEFREENRIERNTDRQVLENDLFGSTKIGADINLSEKDYFSFYADMRRHLSTETDEPEIFQKTYTNDQLQGVTRQRSFASERVHGVQPAGNIYYEHKLKGKEHKLSVNVFYSKWHGYGNSSTDIGTRNTENPEIIERDFYNEAADENVRHDDIQTDLSYEKNFKKGKIEVGFQHKYDARNSELIQRGDDKTSDLLTLPIDEPQGTRYRRHIHQLYTTYSNKLKKLGYQIGIRAELNDRDFLNEGTGLNYPDNWLRLFPSGHLSYELQKKQSLSFSYSSRVTRPNGWNLFNLPEFKDAFTVVIGNPLQTPEYTDSYEFGYINNTKVGLLSTQVYHRNNRDVIGEVSRRDSNGVLVFIKDNINSSKFTGIEASMASSPTKWLDLDLGTNAYFFAFNGMVGDETFSNESKTMDARIVTKFKVSKSTKVNLTHMWQSRGGNGLQSTSAARFFAMLSINQKILKDKGDLSLFVWDLYRSFEWRATNIGEDFKNTDRYLVGDNPLFLTIGFSYAFNNYQTTGNKGAKRNVRESSGGGGGL